MLSDLQTLSFETILNKLQRSGISVYENPLLFQQFLQARDGQTFLISDIAALSEEEAKTLSGNFPGFLNKKSEILSLYQVWQALKKKDQKEIEAMGLAYNALFADLLPTLSTWYKELTDTPLFKLKDDHKEAIKSLDSFFRGLTYGYQITYMILFAPLTFGAMIGMAVALYFLPITTSLSTGALLILFGAPLAAHVAAWLLWIFVSIVNNLLSTISKKLPFLVNALAHKYAHIDWVCENKDRSHLAKLDKKAIANLSDEQKYELIDTIKDKNVTLSLDSVEELFSYERSYIHWGNDLLKQFLYKSLLAFKVGDAGISFKSCYSTLSFLHHSRHLYYGTLEAQQKLWQKFFDLYKFENPKPNRLLSLFWHVDADEQKFKKGLFTREPLEFSNKKVSELYYKFLQNSKNSTGIAENCTQKNSI